MGGAVTGADTRRRARTAAGLVATAGGLALIGSSFLGWISTAMVGGGRTSISGWGTISGGNALVDGVNFNTLMAGEGSFRPGVVVAVVGAVTVIPGLILAVTGPGRRPYRAVGIVLAVCGIAAAAWGTARAIAPGDAVGVLPAGQAGLGAGSVVAAVAGLAICVAAGLLLAGALDPPQPGGRRGVQRRR